MDIRGPYFKVFLADPEDKTSTAFNDYQLELEYFITSLGFILKDGDVT